MSTYQVEYSEDEIAAFETRIAELEAQLAHERSWKETNAAQADKLMETVESLATQVASAEDRAWQAEKDTEEIVGRLHKAHSLLAKVTVDEQIAIARAESAEAERDKLRAVLEGAQYNEIDDMLTRDIEVCRLTGEAVHALTQKYIDYSDQAAHRIEEAEAERDRLRAALESIVKLMVSMQSLGYFTNDEWQSRLMDARKALSSDARQPESAGRAEGEK